jgi:acetyltransferase-like isoleucine patch superfamily enzyme
MSRSSQSETGHWANGELPANVIVGQNSIITGAHAFNRFVSRKAQGLVIGDHCTLDGVHFAIGGDGWVTIGNYCYLTNALLLCELELRIGSYVLMGWNATIADTDFHPIAPAERIADAIACSTVGGGRPRPEILRKAVVIEDDVWIGPNATILKGVRVGTGAVVEAGALVTRDVAPRTRVAGNPSQVVARL